jgi:hypothetical protein
MSTIEVTYCSNYNGASLHSATIDVSEFEDIITDNIVDFAYGDCDDDGCYHGDIDELEEFCVKTIREKFGDVNVVFEEDTFST